MARAPRVDYPGAFHHVMNRGARRAPIFRDGDDCLALLDCLEDASARFGVQVHGYALMPNHYHLLVRSVHGDLPAVMKFIGGEVSRRLNRRHRWDGPIFRGRYRNQLIAAPRHLRYLLPYLHLNPVRAQLVTRPDAECWTSHRAYLGLARKPDWLTTEYFLRLLGGRDGLRELVTGLHKGRVPWPVELDLDSGWIADESATDQAAEGPRATRAAGGARRTPDDLIARVVAISGVEPSALRAERTGPGGNEARRFAVWALLHRGAVSHAAAASALRMSEGAVSKASSRLRRGEISPSLNEWMKRWDREDDDAA